VLLAQSTAPTNTNVARQCFQSHQYLCL